MARIADCKRPLSLCRTDVFFSVPAEEEGRIGAAERVDHLAPSRARCQRSPAAHARGLIERITTSGGAVAATLAAARAGRNGRREAATMMAMAARRASAAVLKMADAADARTG